MDVNESEQAEREAAERRERERREQADRQDDKRDDKPGSAKAADEARAADQKALEARAKADDEGKSDAHREADKAAAEADDKRAAAAQAKRDEATGDVATTTAQAKSLAALSDPERAIGDHHAQKFGLTPANPQLAPGLDPDAGNKVKLVMTTSDFPDPEAPMVAFVNPEMVGDYQRAGWSRA